MPEIPPPANSGQVTQTTRHPTLRLRLRTQPSAPEGALLRTGVYARTGNAPQVFQWIIHDELTPLTADLFILWAKLYDVPGSRPAINLWYDSALPAGRAMQHFLEYRFAAEVSGGESFKAHFLRHYLEEVFNEIDRGGDWPAQLEGYLRSSSRRPAEQEWLRVNELPAMEAKQREQAELLTYIEDSLPGFTINLYDLRPNQDYGEATPESHWYRWYTDLVYQDNLPGWGKNLLIQHLINQGGLTLEAGVLPPLNDSVYPGGLEGILGGLETTAQKVTGQLAVQQLLLKKLRESLGLGSRRAEFIEDIKRVEGENYHGNYQQALADIDSTLALQVNNPNPDSPSSVSDYFKRLNWSVDQSEGVKLANPGLVNELPVVILSKRYAPFAQRVSGFTEGFLRLGSIYRLNLNKIFQTTGEFGEEKAEIKNLRETFLAKYDKEQNLFKNLDISGRSFLTDHPDFEQRAKTLLEVYADSPARSQIDLKGEMTGFHLFINALPEALQNGVRVFDQNRFDLQISYPSEAYALRSRAVSFVDVKGFKKLIILQLSDDAVTYKGAFDIIAKNKAKYGDSFKYYWLRWKRRTAGQPDSFGRIVGPGALIHEGGTQFKADFNDEVALLGHGNPRKIGDFSEGEIASLISEELVIKNQDGTATIDSLNCKGCRNVHQLGDFYESTFQDGKEIWVLRRSSVSQKPILKQTAVGTGSVPVNLLYELDSVGVNIRRGVKATGASQVVLIGGRSYYSIKDSETGQTSLIHRQSAPELKEELVKRTAFGSEARRIRAWLGEDGSEERVFYRLLGDVPDGTVLNTLDFTKWHGELLRASLKHPIRNIAAELTFPPAFETRKYQADLELISLWRNAGDVVLPADSSALIVGMHDVEVEGNHRIVITDPDTVKVGGVIAALDLAARSQSADEFIRKIGHHFSQEIATNLRTAMSRFPDQDAAFERLQNNIYNRQNDNSRFYFNTADITTRRGASFVNEHFTKPFSVVRAELFDAAGCGSGNRRRRQACSPDEIEEQASETIESLTLLSDDETQILTGNSVDDIALHISEPNSVLAKVQEGIHDFRRSTTSQRIRDHEGYHNIIALDSDSFSAAQTLARNSNEEGRALLFNREKGVLLTEDGRVVTMVEGGAHNRVSVVGKTESFSAYAPHELAGGVRTLVRGEKVASVTVHPLLNEGEGFHLQGSFDELGISERSSPWREVADYVRLHALENTEQGVVETGNMQAGMPGKSDTFLFDGDYIRDALNLGRAKQPGVLEAQLRAKMAELHEKGLTAEREVYQSLTLDYANKVRDLRARFEVFKYAMNEVYKAHAELTGKLHLSSENDIPLLSTLFFNEKRNAWMMRFANRELDSHSVRDIEIHDQRIIDFVHDYNDKIEQIRTVLKLNHGAEPEIVNGRVKPARQTVEAPELIDGVGWAMALQTLMELSGKNRNELFLNNQNINPDYRRALIVHQAIGMVFGGKIVLGTVLDIGKYFAALSDGRVVSLPERFASRIASVAKNLEGSLGRGLRATANVAKVSGQIFDGVLILVSIGLDITELVKADTEAGKALAGLQLGLDTSLGLLTGASIFIATLGTSIGLAEATAATISGAIGIITVPLGGIVVGVMGAAVVAQENEDLFNAHMDFINGVYQDLVLNGAYDRDSGLFNLLYRTDEKGKNISLSAPITGIDFRLRSVTYGEINLPKVKGGTSRHTTIYIWKGPTQWSNDDTFNLLDRPRVIEQLRDELKWPDGEIKTVILPAQKNWRIKTTDARNWVKRDVVGCTTWNNRNKGNERDRGWWLLEHAEQKGIYTFTYQVHHPPIFPFIWTNERAMAISFGDVKNSKDFINKNIETQNQEPVSAIMPFHNLTVVVPQGVDCNLFGGFLGFPVNSPASNYSLVLSKRSKTHLYPDTGDRWFVSVNASKPVHPMVSLESNVPKIKLGSNTIWMHNFAHNLTIIDQNNQLQVYVVDPSNPTHYHIINRKPSEIKTSDIHNLQELKEEYEHPDEHTLNPRGRFVKLAGCNWQDLKHDINGGDLLIPTYFEGVIQKDRVLPAGLYVEIFRASSLSDLNQVTTRVYAGNPEGTFVSSQIKYLMDNSPYTLGYFLENDRHSLQGSIAVGTALNLMAFKFTGQIQLEAGQHHFIVGSDDGFRLRVNSQELMKYTGTRSFANSSVSYTVSASGLYGFELLYWENRGGHKLHASMDGYTLNATRLFNVQRHGNTHEYALLPEDTRPIAGWPSHGYVLYSHNTQSLFYRQPSENNTSQDEAHILKLPRQYTGTSFNTTTSYLVGAQNLMVFSSGNIRYQFRVDVNNTEPFTHHPTLTPFVLQWESADYKSSVREIDTDARPHHRDMHPAVVLTDDGEGGKTFCTAGFYDPHGSGGKGRVGVIDPGTHSEVQLKYIEVNSAPYNQSQLLSQTGCFNNGTSIDSPDAFGYLPIHAVRNGTLDFYLVWLQETNKLYLFNTTSGSPQTIKQATLMPLDLLLNDPDSVEADDHLNITNAWGNAIRDGVLARTAHGVILDICDDSIRRSTTVKPNPCIFLNHVNHTLDTDYKLVGFDRGELEGWHLDAVEMEERIARELDRYPEGVLKHSSTVLPIVRFADSNQNNASDTGMDAYTMNEMFHNASCPVREHSWFIRGINRIYGYDGNLTVLGYDPFSMQLFASDMDNQVVTVRMSSHVGNSTEAPCPRPEIYNPEQPAYRSVQFRSGVVWGIDELGRIFQLSQTGQTLVGLDLRNRTDTSDPVQSVQDLTQRIAPLIDPMLEGVSDLPNTSVASQLFLQLPSNWSNYQAWYRNNQTATAEEGVYGFFGSGVVNFLGSTLRNAWNSLTENLYWFFSSGNSELHRQKGNEQRVSGKFSDVRVLGEDSSLLIIGTQGNDNFDAITLGKPSDKNVLYLEGVHGHDSVQVSQDALHHYRMIVIDSRNLVLKGFNLTDSDNNSTTRIEIAALANEFVASFGEQSLLLLHQPSGHYLSLPDPLRLQATESNRTEAALDTEPINGAIDGAISGTSNETNSTIGTNGTASEDFVWKARPVTLSFNGLEISAQEVLKQVLSLPPGTGWYFPINVSELGGDTTLTLIPDHLTLIKADNYSLIEYQLNKPQLSLTFNEPESGENKTVVVDNYTPEEETAGNLWLSSSATDNKYTQLQLHNNQNPVNGFELVPALQEEAGHQNFSRLAAVAITPRAHGWSVVSDHIQINNLTEPLLQHLDSERKFAVLVRDQQNSTSPIYGYQEFDREANAPDDGSESESFGCFVLGRSANDLFILLDQYSYKDFSASPSTLGGAFENEEHEPDYRIDLHRDGTPECLLAFRGIPQGLVFAYDDVLNGWPLAKGDIFVHSQGRARLSGPHWLLPENNPAITLAGEPVGNSGHPVFYNLDPERLQVRWSAGEQQWEITYGNTPVRNIQSDTATYLTLSLVDRDSNGVPQGSSSYLALDVPFSEIQFEQAQSKNSASRLHTSESNDISIALPITYYSGFPTEQDFTRQMLSNAIGRYDGVYFSDGLQSRYDLSRWLSSHPMTIVDLKKTGRSQWQASGDFLNNIIPVQLSSFGQYTVNGEEGNDLILINGGIWASKFSFPVTWSTNSTSTREVNIDGKTVSLTELDIQAIPVISPPSPTGYEMDINPGSGNDVIDLNGAANVRLVESEGQDTWILQHFGFADLKALRDGILFLKDIYSTEVQPVLYNSEFNITVDTLADATEVYLWSARFDPRRYIARLSLDSVTEIHFADGKQVIDVAAWYEHQNGVEDYVSSDVEGSGSGESGAGSGDSDSSPPEDETSIDSVEDTLEDAYSYALASRYETVAEDNTAFNNLDRSLENLIQAMSTFRARRENGVSPSLTTAIPSPTSTLTMPVHSLMSSITLTPTPSG